MEDGGWKQAFGGRRAWNGWMLPPGEENRRGAPEKLQCGPEEGEIAPLVLAKTSGPPRRNKEKERRGVSVDPQKGVCLCVGVKDGALIARGRGKRGGTGTGEGGEGRD